MNLIERYTILKRLGGGGFGEVFLGEDPQIGRQVAIKVFKPKDENLIAFATSSDEEGLEILRARFLNEAKILASLHNERHVIEVLDFGEAEDGAPYYVMPYLPNSLADELGKDVFDRKALEELPEAQRPRALPLERSLELMEQVLKGLAAAHGKGLIHRDIKPSNIMLTEDGEIRIVDFGIAKAPDSAHSSVSHLGLGSRNYMSPEQRESAKHVDARADVYAFGRLAYRMLTGRLPVGRFADPNVAVPALGQDMNDLLLSALDEDRDQRPADAAELLARFEEARSSVGAADEEEDTGTWVGGGEAGVRDEIKPLRARIVELLGKHGRIPSHEREVLLAMAAIADLSEADLDRLIDAVLRGDQALAAKARLIAVLTRSIEARKGILADSAIESLGSAAAAVGWDRGRIQALAQELLSDLGIDREPAEDAKQADFKPGRSLPFRPIAGVFAIVLVLTVAGYGVTQWRAGQKLEAAAEQAWQLAQEIDTIVGYRQFLDDWPEARNVGNAQERIDEIEADTQNLVRSIQDYLNRLGEAVPESGHLDSSTVSAIRAFQIERGLTVTGQIDESLLESLRREFRRRDELAWSEAIEENTAQAFRAYLTSFPRGAYVAEVDGRMAIIAEEQQQIAAETERRRMERAAAEEARSELIRNIKSELQRLGQAVNQTGELEAGTVNLIREFEVAINRSPTGQASREILDLLRNTESWPVRMGRLEVTTFPRGAQIYVDGNLIGSQSGMTLELLEGQHTITARLDGYQESSDTVSVIANETSSVHLILMRGSSDLVDRLTEGRNWCCAPDGQKLCLMPNGFEIGTFCECGNYRGRVCR
ncbi:protein kinase domain-containing protein [Wenzhouxiangella marina]|uniref:Protein kinase domain-containing protein n=1 Tax=Wenzhouxiangella marina TaxID=1579979 RepID=A0A0K0XUR5_9GAMM|nr:protein kinase [Wenzhouxiangella marina]AKS41454.1 hypothetical protein WM2015_1079 [Wenzhouxiangella marina]MBB6086790.1 serine/threonine-protein kinase [Wenzhouxiangella marina]